MKNKTAPARLLYLITISLLTLMPAIAQQSQSTLDETLEKEGCATLERSKVKLCKYDYSTDGKKVEAFTIRPLADGNYPGLVLLAGREGAKTFFNLGTLFAQQGFACVAISELGYGKS